METRLRIATFNLENLDDTSGQKPSLQTRCAVLRPMLTRLDADVLCLQEVHGQEQPGQPRRLLALDRLLEDTPYAGFHRVSTRTAQGQVYDKRNLVVCSRFPIASHRQLRHELAPAPAYRKVTAVPAEAEADPVGWERPLLHVVLRMPDGGVVQLVNLHLKSRLPTYIAGQSRGRFRWKSASGWAEGFFLSSMKRVGQALEARILLDALFDADPPARVVVCGDFNAENDQVPLEAICGAVENTGNPALLGRVLVPCEGSVAAGSRYSLIHRGRGVMLDHILASRALIGHYRGTEIHNELLHDESAANASDTRYPESDHAPVVAQFRLPAHAPGAVGPL
jgi:endonuclease/exonuclease/phosphatase family metal-dependent hydrolase